MCEQRQQETILAVMMAGLRIYYRNIQDKTAYGIMAYDQRLSDFTRWAQQTEMESNGKSDRQGQSLDYKTAPIIWGEAGTGAQHSFFQALHQRVLIAVLLDILAPLQPIPDHGNEAWQKSHHMLLINALAQAEAFAQGQANEKSLTVTFLAAGQVLLSWRATTPYALGRLLALYEHITIASGFLWDVNSFDQYGVELWQTNAHALASVSGEDDMPPQFPSAAKLLWLVCQNSLIKTQNQIGLIVCDKNKIARCVPQVGRHSMLTICFFT